MEKTNVFAVKINCERQKKMIEYFLSVGNNNDCVFGTFVCPLHTYLLAGNIVLFTPSQEQIGKSTLAINNIKGWHANFDGK